LQDLATNYYLFS